MKIHFVYAGFENLGIEYLSAVLKKHGHSTRLAFAPRLFNDPFIHIKYLDKFFNYETSLIKQILNYNPAMVVFSVVSADYMWAVRIAQQVKRHIPLTHITFGGIHPSSVPERVLETDCIDSVIIGEGEYPLLELADSLEKRKIDYSIKNIWFKYDGQIVKNILRPYIDDLDTLPFPDKALYYDIIPQYKSGYTMITRRGCINSCSYCHNAIWQSYYPGQKRIRFRSVKNVILELREAKKDYNFKRLRINDDLFTYNEDWLKEFSQAYKKHIDIPTYCFGSPSTINEKVVQYLKDIKCYQICLGVQSISPLLRERVLNRKEDNDIIKKAIYLCKKYKIRCVVDNIIGLPGESEEDLLAMARFYNRNRPDRICVFWLIYFPKTPIIKVGLKNNILSNILINEIETNPYNVANTLYSKIHSRDKMKYRWLLFLLPFLPFNICNWIIEKKIYSFFPLGSPSIIENIFTIMAKDRLDIPRRRYYIRYFYFIRKKMRIKFRNILPKKISSFVPELK